MVTSETFLGENAAQSTTCSNLIWEVAAQGKKTVTREFAKTD